MKRTSLYLISAMLTMSLVTRSPGFAAEEQELKSLSYPELEVTPKASERLQMEAKKERGLAWKIHIPLQVSALATLGAGVMANGKPPKNPTDKEKENNRWASQTAMLVGGGWLVTTVFMAMSYRPYTSGLKETHKLPTGTTREKLTKERLAEEHLYRAGQVASRMKWLSLASNLIASGFVAAHSDETPAIFAGVSGVLAFSPLVFEHHWTEVAEQHRLYKKKIYGPVAQIMPVNEGTQISWVPGLSWQYDF